MIPSKSKIESFAKRCYMGTVGGKGLTFREYHHFTTPVSVESSFRMRFSVFYKQFWHELCKAITSTNM